MTLRALTSPPFQASSEGSFGRPRRWYSSDPRALPGYVGCRTVRGRHHTTEQTQVDGQLRPMMRRVQDAAPENPDPLALDIEERRARQPPFERLSGKIRQPRSCQLDDTPRASLDCDLGRQHVIGRVR